MAKVLFCNKCGKQIQQYDEVNGFHHSGRFGYGSKYDGELFEVDLCVDCIDELVDKFTIDPIIHNHFKSEN